MSINDYNRIRWERQDLFLPDYHALSDGHKVILHILTPDRLIARRTARLLGRQYCQVDDMGDIQPDPEPEL